MMKHIIWIWHWMIRKPKGLEVRCDEEWEVLDEHARPVDVDAVEPFIGLTELPAIYTETKGSDCSHELIHNQCRKDQGKIHRTINKRAGVCQNPLHRFVHFVIAP